MQTAVDTMKEVLNDQYVAGGITAANGRAWTDGIAQVFGENPTADIYYEGGFVGGIATGQVNKALVPGETIDWTDFPSLGGPDANPVTIGGDVIAALTDKPCVKEFITFMTTADSGNTWAKTGAIISPIKAVSTDSYPTDLVKREAAQVTGASVVKFDGSDLLPAGQPRPRGRAAEGDRRIDRGLGRLRVPGEDRLEQREVAPPVTKRGRPTGPPAPPPRTTGGRALGIERRRRPSLRHPRNRPGRGAQDGGEEQLARLPDLLRAGRRPAARLPRLPGDLHDPAGVQPRASRRVHATGSGSDNFTTLFTNDPNFINLGTFPPSGAVWNNVLWIIFYTGFVLGLGLVIATLASRVRYESIVKAAVFLPQAIAATALAVICKFVYSPDPNIGLLNATLGLGHIGPISFLGDPNIVNWALIGVGTWASVGFATVILSAALKGIPAEILEAARTDGANERQIFFRIILPMVSLPMSVLAVTLIVNVVKLFDLIYVMTNGGPGTSSRVIGFTFYVEGFQSGLFGKAAAVAVVMMVILIPIMIFNIRRFRTASVV